MVTRTASARYEGFGKEGKGHVSTQSGVLSDTPYSFNTRFENEAGTQSRGADRGRACRLFHDGAVVRPGEGGASPRARWRRRPK